MSGIPDCIRLCVINEELNLALRILEVAPVEMTSVDDTEENLMPVFKPFDQDGVINVRFEERYLTLASTIDLVPPEHRDGMTIYRVKPPNEYSRGNKLIYVRKRYVVVTSTGHSICSCLKGRHLGIQCQHVLAVARIYPNAVGFNIGHIHPHWISVPKRAEAQDRATVYLQRETGMEPDIIQLGPTNNIETLDLTFSLPVPGNTTPTTTPMQSADINNEDLSASTPGLLKRKFDGNFVKPPQTKTISHKRAQYAAAIDMVNRHWKQIENDPYECDRYLSQLDVDDEYDGCVGERLGTPGDKARTTQMALALTPHIPKRLGGRPRTSRIKSCLEGSVSKSKNKYKLSSPKRRYTRGFV